MDRFDTLYQEVVNTLLHINGIKRFVEKDEELSIFLREQKEILRLLVSNKMEWAQIEQFYTNSDIQFAIVLRFLKFFRQLYIEKNPHDHDFFSNMELYLEIVAKGYIKKSLQILKQYHESKILEELYIFKTKKEWIEKIITAIETDDLSSFPTESAQVCDFKKYLLYPQSLLICSEAASCSHLDELHTALHKFAAEFYYLYSHQKYSQAYLIFRDLIDTYLQFSNLISEFYFLTHSDLEESFFSLVSNYHNATDLDTYVVMIDYHNLKRLNVLHGEKNVTEGMKKIELLLNSLVEKEPANYLYIKGNTANYYLLIVDKYEDEIEDFLIQFRTITSTKVDDIEYSSFIGAIKLSKNVTLSRSDIIKMLTKLRQDAKSQSKGIVTAFQEEEIAAIYHWLMKKYSDTKLLEEKIAKKELELVFQPIVTTSNTLYALETLIRIKEKEKLIPAFVFIDLLYELDLIDKLDIITLELLEQKLEQICTITSRLFLNASFDALRNSHYLQKLSSLAKKSKERGLEIIIELTEQQLVEHTAIIRELKEKNFSFAVDDFGSGYSSIKTVADLAFENIIAFLKIDGSLIKDLPQKQQLRQIVEAISDMAKAFNLYTIAEFVEDAATFNLLKQKNIDLSQGYYIQKPETIEALIAAKMKEEL